MNRQTPVPDPFSARASLTVGDREYTYYRLDRSGLADIGHAPMTVKILVENVLRNAGRGTVREEEARALASWKPKAAIEAEVPFMPARVLLQDFTGVPAVVDLAAMRDAMADIGGDPARIEPLVPADLVIDHSVQVDRYRTADAFAFNVDREYERNGERYQLLRWAQSAFHGLNVVPPGTGIVHQVNLEYLAKVVVAREEADGSQVAFPDTLVGTDSHTTMVNGLGVLGYGVGGIEAEAVLLGQPLYHPMPRVVGVRLFGDLPRGSTATDLVLVISHMLREHGVVGSFVEFSGDGLASLALGRPSHHLQHVARVRRHGCAFPDRRRDARLPPPDGPRRAAGSAGRALCQGKRAVARARDAVPTSTRRSSSTCRLSSRRSPARAGRRTRSGFRNCATTSRMPSRVWPSASRSPSTQVASR